MYEIDEETGDMFINQGDDFSLRLKDIEPGCLAFFAVSDASHNIIFELQGERDNNDIVFAIKSTDCDLLEVPRGRKQEVYTYGIKICKQVGTDWIDDTLVIGNKKIGEPNKITVYPLLAEGKQNG